MIRRKMRLIAVAGLVVVLAFVLAGGAVAAKPESKAQVLIGFTQPPGPNEQALIHGVGGTIKYTYRLIPVIAATVPESAIAGLLRNPNVTHVNPDGRVYAIEETLPWGVDRIDAEVVHSTNKGAGVKVAIIDTGIDKDHPDLAANIQDGVNFVAKPWWATPDPDAWDDDSGHGSHVAGTVAAVDNDIGVIGVAPEAFLYGVKVLDSTGSGYWSDVIAGIDWSVSNDMQVINMSLGASSAPDDVETACIAAYDAGIVIVAAAGNNGDTDPDDDVIYPAKYASVIAVAATDNTDTRASWSSDGPDVELAAPGVSIPSTWKDGGYDTKSGTSMASPHVAGTAALVIYAGVVTDDDGFYGIANEVRDRMNTTADDLGDPGRDNWYGYGLVDAEEAALGAAEAHDVAVTSVVAPAEVVAGDTVAVDVTVKNEGTYDETFDVTLTDIPPTDGSAGAISPASHSVTLAAGASTAVSFSWDTTGATIGDHTLTASHDLADDDATNDSKSTVVTVEAAAVTDIAITAVSAPTPVTEGDLVAVSVTVENVGNQDVASDITVTLTDDTDSATIDTQTITGLAAGASTTLTFSWDTTGASLGDHTLTASHVFADDDATNDSKSTVVTVEAAAVTDIAITAVSAPTSVTQGDPVAVSVTVENVGNQDVASDINVTLTDDTDSATIDTQTITGLAAGASTILTFPWDTTGASLGDHTLTASHVFADDDATNDSKSTTVSVVEEAAVDVTITRFSARDVRKENYAITAQIKNEGTTAVTITARVVIYNLDEKVADDTLVDKVDVTIDAGGRVNLKWNGLCPLPVGSYIAKVTVDEEPEEWATDTFEVK